MATIITKNSSTTGSVPTAAQLVKGELAVNVTDKRLFTENASGTVVELGTNPSSLTVAGNVGIGTSAISATLDIFGTSGTTPLRIRTSNNTNNSSQPLIVGYTDNETYPARIDLVRGSSSSSTGLAFVTSNNAASTERARIDSSGNLLVGTTSNTRYQANRSIVMTVPANGDIAINHSTSNGSGDVYVGFGYNGSGIGSITQSGTTAVAYNTSSDYRLKENIQPMTGALAKVAALKPCTYKWKADGSDGEGFIAHELAEVVPQCVTGEKDAVDEDGNPVYQGIDTSFLVATLTAAIQELKAEFDAYKAAHP